MVLYIKTCDTSNFLWLKLETKTEGWKSHLSAKKLYFKYQLYNKTKKNVYMTLSTSRLHMFLCLRRMDSDLFRINGLS